MDRLSWKLLDRKGRHRVVFWSTCSIILVFLGIGCLVGAILVVTLGRQVVDETADKEATLEPGHSSYEQFQSPTVPIWKSIYFFNLTNPVEFQSGEKPIVEQIGPYTYREYRNKYILEISEDRRQLTYNQTKTFHYHPGKSSPDVLENDTICTINIPLVAAVAQLSGMNPIEKLAAIPLLHTLFNATGAELHMCLPARELAWNFTTDLLLAMHNNVILRLAGQEPRDWVSIQINGSLNGSEPSIVHTGVGDINKVGQIIQWNGNYRSLSGIWPGDTANYINDTEGVVFRPHPGHTLEVFDETALRTFVLEYQGHDEHRGIATRRYKIAKSTYEGAFTNPKNARWGSWNPDGMFYVGVTQTPPAPAYSSKPHFLDGDPILLEKVEGLSPDPEQHDSVVEVEPISGGNVQFKELFQVVFQVNQTDDFEQLENINGTLYYPVLYVNEHAELTEDFADYLYSHGLDEYALAKELVWVFFSLLLLGAIVCAVVATVGVILCFKQLLKKRSKDEGLLLMSGTVSPTESSTFTMP